MIQHTQDLRVRHISKTYPKVCALDGVSLEFRSGQVHALVGKNGAGKSTLVRILSGATLPDTGSICIGEREVRLTSPIAALKHGIATVYQELSLVPGLTVGENIFLGRLPVLRGGFLLDKKAIYARAEEALRRLNVHSIDVRDSVAHLGMASRQLVEIAKAMVAQPKALLLDEPTSALSREEALNLFQVIRQLAASGVAIIYVTHRLQELFEIADCVSVLRDGRLVNTLEIRDVTAEKIAEMMFGHLERRSLGAGVPPTSRVMLEVRRLTKRGCFEDINFRLHEGEILGIAGMMGSGRTELLRALAGVDEVDTGEIIVRGRAISRRNPASLKRAGVGLAPENRKEEGVILGLSIRENMCLAALMNWSTLGVISRRAQRDVTVRQMKDLEIAAREPEQPVGTLSGGNQQKVVLGKWLAAGVNVLLLDEPTRGIDVQAKYQIFRLVKEMKERGLSVIFVSSELEELFEVCDRIAVMRAGRFIHGAPVQALTLDMLVELCVGRNSRVAEL